MDRIRALIDSLEMQISAAASDLRYCEENEDVHKSLEHAGQLLQVLSDELHLFDYREF